MRGKNLVKFLRAIELVSRPQGATIQEMGERLELDRRSVYRMINVIEELGFPLYDDKIPLEREKRWRLEESYLKKLPNITIPDVNLGLAEIISLYLTRSGSALFKGTDIEKHARSAFGKLSLFVPDETFGRLDKIKALIIPAAKFAKDYSDKEEIIAHLMTAMLEKETCTVKYHSFHDDKIKHFKIDPLHFFENDGGLYLFVNTTTFGDIRTLAVERIHELTKTGSSFEYPVDFDPEALMESAFDIVYGDPIDVRLWFSADQARYIKERRWSKTQKIEEQDDGSIIFSMSTSGGNDVKRWVLSFGAAAEVLEPEELRKEIVADLAAIRKKYTVMKI